MRVITGILAVLALVLSGCSDTADPSTLPTQPPTPSTPAPPAPSPTPTSVSQEPQAEGAVLALEAYFRSANEVAMGGDMEEHQRLYSDSCEACVAATADFETAQAEGLRADTDRFGSWTIKTQNAADSQVLLTSAIEFNAVNLIDGDDIVTDSVPAWSDATFAWTLRQQPNGNWLIVQGQLL
ncbi:MAG: DUF6318 family protein [Jiangellales bacterium]